jgi:predicted transposase/invertase (TIGR01784 family)
MPKKENPHDRFFKDVFSRREAARDFIINYLPEEVTALIDLEFLEISKDSFVDEELQEHFCDILYKSRLKEGVEVCIDFLFEHKSYEDKGLMFQILRYMVKIWDQALKSKKPMCPILPILLYHGPKKWTADVNFQSMMNVPEAIRPFVPEFRCMLFDLGSIEDEELKGDVILTVALLLMKHIRDPELVKKLPKIKNLLGKIKNKETALRILEAILSYLAKSAENLQPADLQEVVPEVFYEGGKVMSTLAERWMEEGIKRGEKRGEKKGKVEESQSVIVEILEFRFHDVPISVIKAVKGIKDLERLVSLRKQALKVDSIEQFEALILNLTCG